MGQNEKAQTLRAKMQLMESLANRNPTSGLRSSIAADPTVWIARGVVGDQLLQRHLADQATRWPEIEEMLSDFRPHGDVACKWRFRSLEAASRSIWGRYARLSQWARRPRAVEGSNLPINSIRAWPKIKKNWSFKSRGISKQLGNQIKGLLLPIA